jgi:flavin reductase (DIM6/NTAB) family NADH-FMN oxidoreductase RutF
VSSKHEKANMHICTYVSAVSMQPKRMMVAIFYGTKTMANVEQNPHFVLQLLAKDQYRLVNQLGKKSGNNIDKIGRLQNRKLLMEWNGFFILKDALAVMELQVLQKTDAGDHCMMLCNVLAYKNLNEGEVLTTKYLHEKGIIRI